jgi:CheY-like chemotaxis protein
MPVILVLEDDSSTRNGLVETLRSLFAGARVASGRSDAAPGIVTVERADVVLASMAAVERLYRNGAPEGVAVVALTREMSPATLMRAEALGVAGALRVPAGAEQLTAVLGPIIDGLPH